MIEQERYITEVKSLSSEMYYSTEYWQHLRRSRELGHLAHLLVSITIPESYDPKQTAEGILPPHTPYTGSEGETLALFEEPLGEMKFRAARIATSPNIVRGPIVSGLDIVAKDYVRTISSLPDETTGFSVQHGVRYGVQSTRVGFLQRPAFIHILSEIPRFIVPAEAQGAIDQIVLGQFEGIASTDRIEELCQNVYSAVLGDGEAYREGNYLSLKDFIDAGESISSLGVSKRAFRDVFDYLIAKARPHNEGAIYDLTKMIHEDIAVTSVAEDAFARTEQILIDRGAAESFFEELHAKARLGFGQKSVDILGRALVKTAPFIEQETVDIERDAKPTNEKRKYLTPSLETFDNAIEAELEAWRDRRVKSDLGNIAPAMVEIVVPVDTDIDVFTADFGGVTEETENGVLVIPLRPLHKLGFGSVLITRNERAYKPFSIKQFDFVTTDYELARTGLMEHAAKQSWMTANYEEVKQFQTNGIVRREYEGTRRVGEMVLSNIPIVSSDEEIQRMVADRIAYNFEHNWTEDTVKELTPELSLITVKDGELIARGEWVIAYDFASACDYLNRMPNATTRENRGKGMFMALARWIAQSSSDAYTLASRIDSLSPYKTSGDVLFDRTMTSGQQLAIKKEYLENVVVDIEDGDLLIPGFGKKGLAALKGILYNDYYSI